MSTLQNGNKHFPYGQRHLTRTSDCMPGHTIGVPVKKVIKTAAMYLRQHCNKCKTAATGKLARYVKLRGGGCKAALVSGH